MRHSKIFLLVVVVGLFATGAFSIRKKAEVHKCTKQEQFAKAVWLGDLDTVKELAKEVDVNNGVPTVCLRLGPDRKEHRIIMHYPPIAVAIMSCKLDVVKYLLKETKLDVDRKYEIVKGKMVMTPMECLQHTIHLFVQRKALLDDLKKAFLDDSKNDCQCETCKNDTVGLEKFYEKMNKVLNDKVFDFKKFAKEDGVQGYGFFIDTRRMQMNSLHKELLLFCCGTEHKRSGHVYKFFSQFSDGLKEQMEELQKMRQILEKLLS